MSRTRTLRWSARLRAGRTPDGTEPGPALVSTRIPKNPHPTFGPPCVGAFMGRPARIFHTRAWSIHTPRRFAPPLSGEGTRSVAGEIPSGEGCPTGRGVSVRIWKCEKPGLERTRQPPRTRPSTALNARPVARVEQFVNHPPDLVLGVGFLNQPHAGPQRKSRLQKIGAVAAAEQDGNAGAKGRNAFVGFAPADVGHRSSARNISPPTHG